jgi:peptidoglycan/LPS O-acetylase OafA/YrhL
MDGNTQLVESVSRGATAVQPAVAAKPWAPTRTGKSERIPALDFTKGALVLIMVLYHWLNYFVGVYGIDYRYLRFLTPSFIFITGFFVSHVYLSKYQVTDTRLPKRLLQRGIKLIAIFLALNLLIGLVVPGTTAALFGNWKAFLIGNSAAGRVAFSVLLPIAYLLILSAALIPIVRMYGKIFQLMCAASLLAVMVLDAMNLGSGYLELLSIGLLGVVLGYLPMQKINAILRHPVVLLSAYMLYLAAVTLWRERFPVQVGGVCVTLAVLYALGSWWGEHDIASRTIILLGQYSLLGYISQIIILQALRRLLPHLAVAASFPVVALVLGAALTILSVWLVHISRKRWMLASRMYAAVFA